MVLIGHWHERSQISDSVHEHTITHHLGGLAGARSVLYQLHCPHPAQPQAEGLLKVLLLLFVVLLAGKARASEIEAPKPKPDALEHKFYDRIGRAEFGVAVAAAAFDAAQTCHGMITDPAHTRELGSPTQHCAPLSLMLGAQVAVQEGVAYFLHRTHHHRIERAVRFFSIYENTKGIVYSQRHGGIG
jgi:hypothetical protein